MTNEPTPIADAVGQLQAGRRESAFSREALALREMKVIGIAAIDSVFPDGDLLNVDGQLTTFAQTRARRPAVVVFYRGAWCPYCNLALAAYRDALAGPLRELNIQLMAISPQKPDGSLSMKERQSLDFAVLSDPGNQLAGALGILTGPSPDVRAQQLAGGLDLSEVNADGTAILPMPTVAIVRADGSLAWIDVHPDYTTRTEPQEVLDAVHRLEL